MDINMAFPGFHDRPAPTYHYVGGNGDKIDTSILDLKCNNCVDSKIVTTNDGNCTVMCYNCKAILARKVDNKTGQLLNSPTRSIKLSY